MRTRTMVLILGLSGLIAGGVLAGDAVLGRDVARDGAYASLSGSLLYEHDEWLLETKDASLELHMGPYGHDESLPFVAGAEAMVRGFVIPGHMSPISVETGGEQHDFWHEGRYPLWAGNGERRNAVETAARGEAPGRQIAAVGQSAGATRAETDEGDEAAIPPGWAWRDDFDPARRNREERPGRGR